MLGVLLVPLGMLAKEGYIDMTQIFLGTIVELETNSFSSKCVGLYRDKQHYTA